MGPKMVCQWVKQKRRSIVLKIEQKMEMLLALSWDFFLENSKALQLGP